ncbi:AIPR family protein [Pseudactinotalea suaedae]|uniref:AIPR family protein n=1 Tax=Pseudactinotalea suaedae TaxID=1524924 RepID=UPI0012E0E7A2|nr:AIPR family protein [Pseudactinotalea suaedae]
MALDQITKALVDEYLNEANMPSQGEPTDYERFAAFVLLSPHIDAAVDYTNVMCGSGGDTGLDAVGIVVNGELVSDIDDVEALSASGSTLDVTYIFIQTETATSFSTAKIGQIAFGVKDFFAEVPSLAQNDIVKNASEVSRQILSNARLFRNGNPTCSVYYVTSGRWTDDNDLSVRVAAARSDIDELNLFSAVQFTPLGAREMQRRYQSLRTGVEKEFTFQNRIALPDIQGVAEAHLGYIPAADLLTVLGDEDGNLMSTAFYENVRDFQGESNAVNAEIAKTLGSDSRGQFPLLNNGVTIIAKSVRQVGTRFVIQDFQVVNGCQTCNVLWTNRDALDPTVLVPLRLISTDDEDVIVAIIRATNRQTEVKEEQFFATSDYLKQLELFFDSTPTDRRLFLERRSKQHANAPVERTRVVPFNNLVRAFASVILDDPHRATRNYRQLLERIPQDILNPNHRPAVYMAAASALYRLEFLFRNGALDRRFTPAKYHLLLASRLIAEPKVPKMLNGSEADRWASRLIDLYWNAPKAEGVFRAAAQTIDVLAQGDLSRDRIRTLPFTEQVLRHYATTSP